MLLSRKDRGRESLISRWLGYWINRRQDRGRRSVKVSEIRISSPTEKLEERAVPAVFNLMPGVADNQPGSLREAITMANANGESDTINLADGNYTLTISGSDDANAQGDLDIASDGGKGLTITGMGGAIIMGTGADRVIEVLSGANLTLSGLTITSGSDPGGTGGGGIRNQGSLTASNVTISKNSAQTDGGGLFGDAGSSSTLTNVTISGNTAQGDGGGIASNGTLMVTHGTIASNKATANGGGVSVAAGTATITNTIIADNTAATGPDAEGSFTSGGNNLVENGAGQTGFTDGTNNDIVGTDPGLGALMVNSKGPATHAIGSSSAALDVGAAGTATDARGITRPQGPAADIGAFEFEQSLGFSIDDVTIMEGNSGTATATFTVTRTFATEAATIDVESQDGTAKAGEDYVAVAKQTLSFAVGELSKTVTVTVNGDIMVEDDETFTLMLSNPSSMTATITKATGTGTITNDDMTVSASIMDVTQAEGNNGNTTFNFTIALSGAVPDDVEVTVATLDGTAIAGQDYTMKMETVKFGAGGSTSQTFSVNVTGDRTTELDENFFVKLSDIKIGGMADSKQVNLGTSQVTGTITNDDQSSLSINNVSGAEGSGQVTFTVTLLGEVDSPLTVDYVTQDGTAIAGSDYTTSKGTLNFAGTNGETKTFTVNYLADPVVELDESFDAIISNAIAGGRNVVIGSGTGSATIQNDDEAQITISEVNLPEDGGTMTFAVRLSKPADVPISVDITTANMSASSDAGDFTQTTQTLTFPAGDTAQTFTVDITNDDIVEASEFFELIQSNVVNMNRAVFAGPNGKGTIQNDDLAFLSISNASGAENGGPMTFTVTLTGNVDQPFSVDFSTSAVVGQADAGADFAATNGSLVFQTPTSGATRTFTVSPVGDLIVEPDEIFRVLLSNVQGLSGLPTIGAGVGVGTITNDDTTLGFIGDATLIEGDDGTQNLVFTVGRSDNLNDVFVTFETQDDTAVAGTDYAASGPQVVFFPRGGSLTQTISIPIVGDRLVEGDERFFINLTSPVNATLADNQSIGNIINNDSAQFLIGNVTAEEDNGPARFTITLTSPVDVDTSVTVATQIGTAGTSDYTTIATQTVNFPAGSTSQTVDVTLNDDAITELNETFQLIFTGLNTGNRDITLGNVAGTALIVDDDLATLSIGNAQLAEDGGSLNFTVTLTGDVEEGFLVNYGTSEISTTSLSKALAGIDFANVSGTLAFAGTDGETQTFSVPLLADLTVEVDEIFNVLLSNIRANNRNVQFTQSQAVGTIVNDDGTGLFVSDGVAFESNDGTIDLTFTVTRTDNLNDVQVSFQTTAGTATAGTDFTSTGLQSLFFAAGGPLTQTVTVKVRGDRLVEANETLTLNLSAPVNASLIDASGTGTILNDDTATLSVTSVTGREDIGTMEFTVTLVGDVDTAFSVDFETTDINEALGGTDFTETNTTLNFTGTNGEVRTVTVAINNDAIVELTERFQVNLSNIQATGRDVQLLVGTGTGTITNDDAASVSIGNITGLEDGGPVTFTVTLTGDVDNTFTVDFATADIAVAQPNPMMPDPTFPPAGLTFQAENGFDYAPTNGRLVFAGTDGETQTFTVSLVQDEITELNELFNAILSNLQVGGRNVSISNGVGVGTITNDDGTEIFVSDAVAVENNDGSTDLVFTVTRQDNLNDVSVDFATADGTALAASDYVSVANQTLFFAAGGPLSQTVTIKVHGDRTVENNETLLLNISNPVGGQIVDAQAIGTILNDDSAIFTINSISKPEGSSPFVFTITLSNPVDVATSVNVTTIGGLATTTNNDFAALNAQTVNFAIGETSQTISVTVNDDSTIEPNEDFSLLLSGVSASGRSVTSGAAGLATILNDDTHFLVSDATVVEGNDGTAQLVFTVTRTDNQYPVSVDVVTSDGTASSASDYEALGTTRLFFAANGPLSQTVSIPVRGDRSVENSETLFLDLSNAVGATISDTQGIGTILNDDSASLNVNSITVREDSGVAEFTVSLIGEVSTGFSIDFTTTGIDDALAGQDFVATNGTLNFTGSSGETRTFTVSLVNDSIVELTQRFNVNLSNINANGLDVRVGTGTGTATITDDDIASVSINNVSALEDSGLITFTVTLTGAVDSRFTIDYATGDIVVPQPDPMMPDPEFPPAQLNSQADSALDFNANSGRITFDGTNGETHTVTVRLIADQIVELNELFNLNLSNLQTGGRNVVIANGTGTGTITNDDGTAVFISDATVFEGNDGTTDLVFTVTRTDNLNDVTVDYSSTDITAIAGSDYTAIGDQRLFFAAGGDLTKTITVKVRGDRTVESNESFSITLSNPVNASISDATAIGAILNDDASVISINNVARFEATGPFIFTITLSNPVDAPVSVDLSTINGAAIDGIDFVGFSNQTVTFAAGETLRTFSVDITDETVVEPDETFTIGMTNLVATSTAITLGTIGTGTILNDDTLLTINDVTVLEGPGNFQDVSFTVTRTDNLNPVTVRFQTVDGTALAGSDYLALTPTTLFFNAGGALTQSITVRVRNENLVELDESFTISLSNATGATISDAIGQATILNDDSTTITIDDISRLESGGPFEFTVNLSNPVDVPVTVTVATMNGTATVVGNDFAGFSQAVTFAAGETSQVVSITVNDDDVIEPNETFTLGMSSLAASARSVIANDTATATIENDDTHFLVSDATVVEGADGTTQLVFTVVRTDNRFPVSVEVNTQDGTATAGVDYSALTNQTLFFAAGGALSQTVAVQVNSDRVVELNELLTLQLSNAIGATISDTFGEGTILNDDTALITIANVTQRESTGLFTFTATMSNPVDVLVTAQVSTANGSATLTDNDYAALANLPLVFSPGATSTTFTVTVNDNSIVEPDENFFTILSGLAAQGRAVSLGSGGIGTILNDDTLVSIGDVTLFETDTGTKEFVFTVTRTDNSAAVSVDFSTAAGTATAGVDYTELSNHRLFFEAGGDLSKTVRVQVRGDRVVEDNETFFVNLTNPVGVTISDNQAVGTILNDDSASFSINSVSNFERDGSLTFTVTLSNPVDVATTINVSTQNGTASVANNDYTAVTDLPLTFAPGVTQQNFTVLVNDDDVVEANETLLAVFGAIDTGDRAVTIATGGVGTIINDDTLITITDAQVVEGKDGQVDLVFQVRRTDNLNAVRVDLQSSAGTARAGFDYTALQRQTIFFAAGGDLVQNVVVKVNADNVVELDETLFVDLLSVDSATIVDSQGLGTILNDDTALVQVDSNVSGKEASSLFTFTVSLSNPIDIATTVDLSTLDGSATSGSGDYNAITNQTLVFNPGVTSLNVSVTINNDRTVEGDEIFSTVLSNLLASGRAITLGLGKTGTILNDDTAQFSVNSVTGLESSGQLQFTVTLSNPIDVLTSIAVNTSDGSASATEGDYQRLNNHVLEFAPGQTSQTFNVTLNNDSRVEGDETFFTALSLVNPGERTVTVNGNGTGTIVNDDTSVVSIADFTNTEDSGLFSFVVSLSNPVDQVVTVGFSTLNGTASTGDNDFVGLTDQVVTFAPGVTRQIVNVVVNRDNVVEATEVFLTALSNLQSGIRPVTIGSGSTGTITNDDRAEFRVASDLTFTEDNGVMTYTVILTNPVDINTSITVSTVDGTASSANGDFNAITNRTLSFGKGVTSQTFSVRVNEDRIVEGDEIYEVVLGALNNNGREVFAGDGATGTILNDDSAQFSIDNVSRDEQDGSLIFHVTLNNPVDVETSVEVSTRDGSAKTSDRDYRVLNNFVVTFAPGQTSREVVVDVIDDNKVEIDESFNVEIVDFEDANRSVSLSNRTLGTGTIQNDDRTRFSINNVSVVEDNAITRAVNFTITIDNPISEDITVLATTADESAIGNEDYIPITRDQILKEGMPGQETIVFDPRLVRFLANGELTQTFTVYLKGDTKVETDETFQVRLSDPRYGTVNSQTDASRVGISDGIGIGTIVNEDSAHLTIDDVTAVETNTGFTQFIFNVKLDHAVQGGFDLSYHTTDGSAAAGSDYRQLTRSLTFNGTQGEVQQVIVEVAGDGIVEGAETFFVNLDDFSNLDVAESLLSILDSPAIGTILNDDVARLTIRALPSATRNELDSGTRNFEFEVTSDTAVQGGFIVNYRTFDGTAISATASPDNVEDFVGVSNAQLSFTGRRNESRIISIAVNGDLIVEGNEDFQVVLGDILPVESIIDENNILSDVSATGNILNDDTARLFIVPLASADQDEGDPTGTRDFEFGITSDRPVQGGFIVNYSTVDGSATAASGDFTGVTNSPVRFRGLPDEVQLVAIQVNSDNIVELDELFRVALGSVSFPPGSLVNVNNIISGDTADGNIRNDDSAVITITDVSSLEGVGGQTQTYNFVVSMSNPVDIPVTVRGDTSDVTAKILEKDYNQINGQTITFAPGSTFQNFNVTVNGEDKFEDDEFFLALLSQLNAQGRAVTIQDNTGIGTILYDDVNPDGAFGGNVYIRGVGTIESGTSDQFNVSIRQGKDPTTLGFLVTAQPDSNFNPAPVEIYDADGNLVPVQLSQTDVPFSERRVRDSNSNAVYDTGIQQSQVIAQLPDGDYTVRIIGENGSTGVYQADVLIPGDLDGDDTVGSDSIELATAAILQSQLGGSSNAFNEYLAQRRIDITSDQYRIELDVNRDGAITNKDLPFLLANVDLPTLEAIYELDRPANSQTLVPNGIFPGISATSNDLNLVTVNSSTAAQRSTPSKATAATTAATTTTTTTLNRVAPQTASAKSSTAAQLSAPSTATAPNVTRSISEGASLPTRSVSEGPSDLARSVSEGTTPEAIAALVRSSLNRSATERANLVRDLQSRLATRPTPPVTTTPTAIATAARAASTITDRVAAIAISDRSTARPVTSLLPTQSSPVVIPTTSGANNLALPLTTQDRTTTPTPAAPTQISVAPVTAAQQGAPQAAPLTVYRTQPGTTSSNVPAVTSRIETLTLATSQVVFAPTPESAATIDLTTRDRGISSTFRTNDTVLPNADYRVFRTTAVSNSPLLTVTSHLNSIDADSAKVIGDTGQSGIRTEHIPVTVVANSLATRSSDELFETESTLMPELLDLDAS